MLKDDGSDYEVNTVKGSCPGCAGSLKYHYLGGISPHYKVDRLQQDGATLLLSSEEGHGRMFVYEPQDYRVISSSVVMGAIANSDSLNLKPYLVSEFVNYFIGYNPVTSLTENIDRITDDEVFPNPFSNNTSISFRLAKPEWVTIIIVDVNGQPVKTVANGNYMPGEHRISWESTNDRNEPVKTGFYICLIKAGNFVKSKKLIILP